MSKNEKGKSEAKNEGTNKKQIFIIAVIVVLLAAIGVLLYLLLTREPEQIVATRDPMVPRGGRGNVLTPDNIDSAREEFGTPSPDDQYTVSMTTNWEFETSRTPSRNAIVNNLDINSRTICFDVYITDPWEVIYCSPFLPLGSTDAGFALDKDLDPGVYDAVVVYFLVDDDFEVITSLSIAITITVNG